MGSICNLFVIAAVIASAVIDAGAEYDLTVEPYAGVQTGYTRYSISGVEYDPSSGYYYWESKLKWPVETTVAGVDISIEKRDSYSMELSFRKNILEDTGEMKDWDYIDDSVVIYSESDTSFDMFEVNLRGKLIYPVEAVGRFALRGGFRYQDFSFDARDTVQTSIYPAYNASVNGLTVIYDVTYYIPYFGIGYSTPVWENFSCEIAGDIGYVVAKDEDDHVLRYKIAKGDATGYSRSLSALLRYDFSPLLFLTMRAEYLAIDAEGEQSQRWYESTSEAVEGTTIKGIDLDIKSEQSLIMMGLGMRF